MYNRHGEKSSPSPGIRLPCLFIFNIFLSQGKENVWVISPRNFSTREFLCECGCGCGFGLQDKRLAEVLQRLRDHLNETYGPGIWIKITGPSRCAAHTRRYVETPEYYLLFLQPFQSNPKIQFHNAIPVKLLN